jgi:K+ transporter
MDKGHSGERVHAPKELSLLALTALGIVFGDIGTSPLYAFRECFLGPHALTPSIENVLGVLSLIIWSLLLIIGIKYATLILRADNEGEGGILALVSLLSKDQNGQKITGEFLLPWD